MTHCPRLSETARLFLSLSLSSTSKKHWKSLEPRLSRAEILRSRAGRAARTAEGSRVIRLADIHCSSCTSGFLLVVVVVVGGQPEITPFNEIEASRGAEIHARTQKPPAPPRRAVCGGNAPGGFALSRGHPYVRASASRRRRIIARKLVNYRANLRDFICA